MTYSQGTNEAGGTTLTPVVFKTTLAAMDVIDGSDYFEAKKLQAQLTYMFTSRYLQGITPDMLVQYQTRTFLIQDILNVQEKNEFMVVIAVERIFRNG
jgi:SPP1 family predicted phage head-tail adaptor